MSNIPLSVPLLSADEEVRLARRIEAGVAAAAVLAGHELRVEATRGELERIAGEGEQARERFLLSNLRLVAFATGGLTDRAPGVARDELFQEGAAALAGALRSYDWRRGRFSTHAFSAIRWKVSEYAASRGGSLGVPASRAVEIRRARSIAARLEAESGRPAELGAVATELGVDEASSAALLRYRPPVSIEAMPPQFQEETLADAPASGVVEDVRPDIRRLRGDQREVITLRFGLADGRPRSWLEVAEETRKSESTVKRLCKRGLEALRSAAGDPHADTGAPASARMRETASTLQKVDRLSRAGLCLVEVAIALKTEPVEIHDMCLVGRRQDLLARFGRLEQSFGFEPGPYTAPYVKATEESVRRRQRFLAAGGEAVTPPPHETVTPPTPTDPRLVPPSSEQRQSGRSISW